MLKLACFSILGLWLMPGLCSMESKDFTLATLETKQGKVRIINLKDYPEYLEDFKVKLLDYEKIYIIPYFKDKLKNIDNEIEKFEMSCYNKNVSEIESSILNPQSTGNLLPFVLLALDKGSHIIGQIAFKKGMITMIDKQEPEILEPMARFAFVDNEFRNNSIGTKLAEVGFEILYKNGYRNVFNIPLTDSLKETYIKHGAYVYGECYYNPKIKSNTEDSEGDVIKKFVLNYKF